MKTSSMRQAPPADFADGPISPDNLEMETWLQQLPVGNAEKSARAILQVLKRIAATPMDVLERFELLEQVRPRLWLLQAALDSRIVTCGVTPDPVSESISRLSLSCHAEYASVCRQIIQAPGFTDKQRINPAIQATVMYRFMNVQAHFLVRMACLYRTPDPSFWSQLYDGYSRSQSMGLVSHPVIDSESGGTGVCSIESIFKALVLFSLSDHCRFDASAQRRLFARIVGRSHHCRIARTPSGDYGKALFFADLGSSSAPAELEHRDWSGAQTPIFFFTRVMAEKILKDQMPAGSTPGGAEASEALSRELDYRLVRRLAVPQKRKSLRISEDEETTLAVGLEAILARFGEPGCNQHRPDGSWMPTAQDSSLFAAAVDQGQSGKNSAARFGRLPDLVDIPDFELVPMEEDCESGYQPFTRAERLRSEYHATASPASINFISTPKKIRPGFSGASTAHRRTNAVETERVCTRINSGIGGICLQISGIQEVGLSIGELVALPGENDGFELGVVRWMGRGDRVLRFGLELLSSNALPARVSNGDPSVEIEGLMFDTGNGGKGLILQSAIAALSGRIRVRTASGDWTATSAEPADFAPRLRCCLLAGCRRQAGGENTGNAGHVPRYAIG